MSVYVSPDDIVPIIQSGSRRFITVFLGNKNNKETRNWRCPNCGRIMFQYTGDINFIYDGAILPMDKANIDVMCNRCKLILRII